MLLCAQHRDARFTSSILQIRMLRFRDEKQVSQGLKLVSDRGHSQCTLAF